MKGYKINTTLYVFPQTPDTIPNDCGADKIAVQLEDLAAWKEENDDLADKIFGYNYNTMTINKKEWADYLDEDIPDRPVLPPPGLAFVYEDLQVDHWAEGSYFLIPADRKFAHIDFLNPHNVNVNWTTSDENIAWWSSADEKIAIVKNAVGEATLTATFEGDDNYSAQTVTVKITAVDHLYEYVVNFLYDETTSGLLVDDPIAYTVYAYGSSSKNINQEVDSSAFDVTYYSPTYTAQVKDYDEGQDELSGAYAYVEEDEHPILIISIVAADVPPQLVTVNSATASYAGGTGNAVGQGETVKVHADTNESPLANYDGAVSLFDTTIENNNTFAYDTLTVKGNPVNFSVSYTTVGESTPELTGLKFVDTDESKDMFAIDLDEDTGLYELTVYNDYYGDFIFSTTQYAINFAADYSELIADYEDIDTANGNQLVFLAPLSETFLDDYTMTVEETVSGDPITVGESGTDFMMPAAAVTVTITENVVPENRMYFDAPDEPDSDIILDLVDDTMYEVPADISLALKTNANTDPDSSIVEFGYDIYRGGYQVDNVQAEPDVDMTYIETIDILNAQYYPIVTFIYDDVEGVFTMTVDDTYMTSADYGTYRFVKKTVVP